MDFFFFWGGGGGLENLYSYKKAPNNAVLASSSQSMDHVFPCTDFSLFAGSQVHITAVGQSRAFIRTAKLAYVVDYINPEFI